MARRAFVPQELRNHPFTIAQARRAGLERWHLEGTSWRHLGTGLYAWSGLEDTPLLVLSAIQLTLPGYAVFSGRTAGWVHRLDTPPLQPAEITVPDACGITPTKLTSVRRAKLDAADVDVVRTIRVTSLPRTLLDLSIRMPLLDAVIAIDTALRLRSVTVSDLLDWSADRAGTKGIVRFRQALDLADPRSESPMETRLRVLLVQAGLPRPITQAELHDQSGSKLGRVDLYFPSHRLAVEYDGGTHRDTLADDNRRQNGILAAGYQLLRFTAGDVLGNSAVAVARVRDALRRRPAAA